MRMIISLIKDLRVLCLLFNLFLISLQINAQADNADSLKSALQRAKHDSDKVNAYVNYCFAVVESNPDTVVVLCSEALQTASNLKDSTHFARIWQNMGIAYDIKNNLDSCLFFLTKARMLYRRMGQFLKESFVVNDMAIAYHFRGVYELALRLHYESLALREKAKDKKLIAQAYNNIGLIYRAKKDYENAIRVFRQSLALKQEINDSAGIINTSMNIGSSFQYMKQFDSALFYAKQCEVVARKFNKPVDITGAVGNIGVALKGLKKYTAAIPFLIEALDTAKAKNYTSIILTCYQGLGDVYFETMETAKALAYYQQGETLAASSGRWKEQLAAFYEGIAYCYAEEKQFEKAYTYFRYYKGLQDTLLNEENTRHINEMNALYEKDKKENEIFQLHNDVEKGNAVTRQSLKERNYLLLSSLLLLSLAGVSFFAYRSNRKKASILNEQKTVIEKALADREVLLKEIHHRVKNNMQIVSSLLDLQSISTKDSQAAEAMKDGKNRVQSMALIHQNLYQQENLKSINAKEYIGQLLMNLQDSYNITAQQISLSTSIQDLNIDIDTMIPVGLIMNELITNAFKYAVPNAKEPSLEIVLKEEGEKLYLKVKDNGPGFPGDTDVQTAKTFGLRMVRAFAQKLKATTTIENSNGAMVELFISKYKIV